MCEYGPNLLPGLGFCLGFDLLKVLSDYYWGTVFTLIKPKQWEWSTSSLRRCSHTLESIPPLSSPSWWGRGENGTKNIKLHHRIFLLMPGLHSFITSAHYIRPSSLIIFSVHCMEVLKSPRNKSLLSQTHGFYSVLSLLFCFDASVCLKYNVVLKSCWYLRG